jgi:prepilin-type N-terminal cleavage/methylation domain-containing protein
MKTMNLIAANPMPMKNNNATPPARRVTRHPSPVTRPSSRAFTLIELLVVISIIGIIAGFTLTAMGSINRNKKISTARGELSQIETALENYKAKYGVYPPSNQNLNSIYLTANDRSQFSQLYYELSGTTVNGANFVTLDGSSTIPIAFVTTAYGVGGFINCTKGGGEDAAAAKNFLSGLNNKQYNNPSTPVTNNGVGTTVLLTSVGGPDASYLPFGPNSSGLNPIRYVCPGTNNPTSYDLWVQLQINGKKYLVCNWSKAAQVNTPYP